jgi:hypothetical protein
MVWENPQTKPSLGGLDQTRTKSDQTNPITVYLRYAMTILYAWRHKRPGYETLRSTIWLSRLIWASPGKYVRKSSLQSIGGLIGEHFDQTFDDEEDPSSYSAMSQALTAKFRAVIDALPSDGDDDDGDGDSDDDAVE